MHSSFGQESVRIWKGQKRESVRQNRKVSTILKSVSGFEHSFLTIKRLCLLFFNAFIIKQT